MDAREFLVLAQQLVEGGNPPLEAALRTAASRAYYSAYHAAQEIFNTTVNRNERAGGMHARFIQSLTNSSNKNDRAIGYMLKSIYDLRIAADYDLSDVFKETQCADAVKKTQKLIEALPKSKT